MKNCGLSARKAARQGLALGCLIIVQLVGARSARAESPRKVEGYELLGTLGYGIQFWDSDAFGVTVGADFGYTFPFGLRLGTDAGYAFGRTVETTNWMGEVSKSHASSLTWGGSFGYDLVLSSFRLRGAADVGLIVWMDEGTAAPWIYFGPKVGLTWQYRGIELGVQSRWMMWTGTVQVGLMAGTRF